MKKPAGAKVITTYVSAKFKAGGLIPAQNGFNGYSGVLSLIIIPTIPLNVKFLLRYP